MAAREVLTKFWCVSLLQYAVANSITFQTPQDCKKGVNYNEYFHIGRLECRQCSQTKQLQTVSGDGLSCVCERGHRLTKDNGGSEITCVACPPNEVASADKWSCVKCDPAKNSYNPSSGKCNTCTAKNINVERLTDGSWFTLGGSNTRTCQKCEAKTRPDVTGSRCERCTQILSVGKADCDCTKVVGGICFKDSDTLVLESEVTYNIKPLDSEKTAVKSYYMEQNLRAVDGMCRRSFVRSRPSCSVRPGRPNGRPSTNVDTLARTPNVSFGRPVNQNFSSLDTHIVYGNLTACQVLGNLCTLLYYHRDIVDKDACELYVDIMSNDGTINVNLNNFQPASLPWLYYDDNENADITLTKETIKTNYNFYRNNYNSMFHFKVAKYSLNGDFLGLSTVAGGTLQLCKDTQERLDAAYIFGTAYYQSCLVDIDTLWDESLYPLVFYDLYLEHEENKGKLLHAIPVLNTNYKDKDGNLPNKEGSEMKDWKLVRRFFLVDNIATKQKESEKPSSRKKRHFIQTAHPKQDGKTTDTLQITPARYVRYAKSMELIVRLQKDNFKGQIYSPYLKITYAEASYNDDFNNNKTTQLTFSVTYEMNQEKQTSDLNIAIGVMAGTSVIWAFIQTWSWFKRSGRVGIDCVTITKFILHTISMISSAFFVVVFSATLWWVVFFKRQDEVYLLPHTVAQETSFIAYLSIAFAFKCIHVLHMIICQLTIDIFFIDWERPRSKNSDSDTGQGDTQSKAENSVSIWRTYFVANEWNEIQSLRKINPALQVFATVFFLNVVGFEFLATRDPSVWYSYQPTQYQAPHSRVFRVGLGATTFLIVAMTQWIFFTFIYDRFFMDAIRQFTDLCSMANISVFIMEQPQYGYYIHGRSPHGKADTGLKEMSDQLKREEENLCGHRGLLPNTEDQVFMMALPRRLRTQYDRVIVPLHQEAGAHPTNRMERGQGGQGAISQFDKCVEAYNMLNRFLGSFIDHALRDTDYIVKNKLLFESILNTEFEDTSERGTFYTDTGGTTFANVLFYGNETTLLMFDVMLFCIADLIAQNFIIAGIVVYIVDRILIMGRDAGGERNLAKKTLVDERFLI